MNRLTKAAIWSSTCIAALGTAGTASAQAVASDQSNRLDEIVVTAQKRSENLRDVPISITAVSAEEIEQRGLKNVRDLQFAIPNLTTYTIGNFSPNIIIRGISSSARNIGFESSLGVYIDGVYQGRADATTQELEDIERIEVLRGPQGTLFGKNTTSGAISITTQTPGNAFKGYINGEYGNFNTYRISAGVSGALVTDKVFGKISAFGSGRDGYIKNANPTGPRDFDNDRARGVRAELRLEPTEGLDITLRGDWSRNVYRDYELEVVSTPQNDFGLPENGLIPGPRTINVNGNSDGLRRIYGTSLTINYEIGDHTLTSISAYRDLRASLNLDLDGTTFDYLTSKYDDRSNHLSQEIRLASPSTGKLKYVIGAYYFDQTAKSLRNTIIGIDTRNALIGAGIPDTLFDPSAISTSVRTRTKSVAGFVNASYEITDELSFLAGVRVTNETKRLDLAQTAPPFLSLPGVLAANPIYLTVGPVKDKLSDTDVSPTAGLSYKISSSATAYVRYSKGFKSGGWNSELLAPNVRDPLANPTYFDVRNVQFQSENIQNYEAGAKADLFDKRVRVNAALFWTIYSDIQISRFVGGLQGYRTENAGRATSKGFEVEIAARPIKGLDLSASVGYADAKYTRYANGCGDGCNLDGTRLDAPRWTAGLSGQYVTPLTSRIGLLLRADYAYRSERPGTGLPIERAATSLPAVSTVDGRIGLTFGSGLELSIWGKNIFNKDYLLARGPVTDNALISITQITEQYGPPRTYGVRASYKF